MGIRSIFMSGKSGSVMHPRRAHCPVKTGADAIQGGLFGAGKKAPGKEL